MNVQGVYVTSKGKVRARVRDAALANKFCFDLSDDDQGLSIYISTENRPNAILAAAAFNGDLADLLDRAFEICDRIGDGAPDDSPLALEALQLAGDIRTALGDAA